MITVKETTNVTLNTPEEIADHLVKYHAESTKRAQFKSGEVVSISSRAGIGYSVGIGDVAVVMFDVPGEPWSHVLMLNSNGNEVVVQVPTDNLSKRKVEE